MNSYDSRELFDTLETARIYAGAEFERLCNNNQHIDACVFQSIRDSIAQNIQLLQSYVISKAESEKEMKIIFIEYNGTEHHVNCVSFEFRTNQASNWVKIKYKDGRQEMIHEIATIKSESEE